MRRLLLPFLLLLLAIPSGAQTVYSRAWIVDFYGQPTPANPPVNFGRVYFDTATQTMKCRTSAGADCWGTGGGITNGAGANVIPKSDGTNLVTSSLSDNGTNVISSETFLASANNTKDIGSSGVRWLNGYFGNIDVSAGVTIARFANSGTGHLFYSGLAPTIASGFGSSPSITIHNGLGSFRLNVGTGGSASSGVITMPAAATGWNCFVDDLTAAAAHVAYNTRMTASTTTSVTVENQTTSTGAAVAWGASDILQLICFAN